MVTSRFNREVVTYSKALSSVLSQYKIRHTFSKKLLDSLIQRFSSPEAESEAEIIEESIKEIFDYLRKKVPPAARDYLRSTEQYRVVYRFSRRIEIGDDTGYMEFLNNLRFLVSKANPVELRVVLGSHLNVFRLLDEIKSSIKLVSSMKAGSEEFLEELEFLATQGRSIPSSVQYDLEKSIDIIYNRLIDALYEESGLW